MWNMSAVQAAQEKFKEEGESYHEWEREFQRDHVKKITK